jgi:Asp/Glu/hydantoin racemase
MSKRLALLHTVSSLVDTFNNLAKEILPPGVEVMHIADEVLLKIVLNQGGLSSFIYRRVSDNVVAAEQAGADVVLLTCSSISPCAEPARLMVNIPVLKVDEPMVAKAISLGVRIGVAATAPTTLKPTTDLVVARAAAAKKEVQVDAVLCQGAYDALLSGDTDTHDQIIRETLQTLMSRNDVIVLAQASMARVVDTIPAEAQLVPILSSPRLAMAQAGEILKKIA